MNARPRVMVVGATGAQGGSVARHLLAEGRCRVRCMTRQLDSVPARALADAGAEVVRGDMSDRDSLDAALAGCEAAFGVTSYFEHLEGEYALGATFIDAVVDSAVEHLVLSTLPSASALSAGRLQVPIFEQKARLEALVRSTELLASFVHVSFYYENFLFNSPPRRQPDGSYAFGFPMGASPFSAVSVEDVGGVVAALFRDPKRHAGAAVSVVGDQRSAADYAAVIAEVTGREVRYQHIPREDFADLPIPGAPVLADMFELLRTHLPPKPADLARCRELYPGIRDFAAWALERRDALLAAMEA